MEKKKKKKDSYYESKSLSYGIHRNREKKLLSLIEVDLKDRKVLDIGCSTGYLGSKIKERGAEVIGIDISSEAVKQAGKLLDKAMVVDLNEGKLPFKDNTFDLIIASELIEHLFQPIIILKEIYRILKPTGKVLLSTPNLLYWGNRLKFLKGEFVYQKSGVFDEGHVHFYTHATLKDDLEKAGLKIVKYNHVFAGSETLNIVKNKFPGVFAYQFVILCEKSLKTS